MLEYLFKYLSKHKWNYDNSLYIFLRVLLQYNSDIIEIIFKFFRKNYITIEKDPISFRNMYIIDKLRLQDRNYKLDADSWQYKTFVKFITFFIEIYTIELFEKFYNSFKTDNPFDWNNQKSFENEIMTNFKMIVDYIIFDYKRNLEK